MAMNYQCPKYRVDLRHRFKGIFQLTCPECGVRLFRTVSRAEVEFTKRIDLQLWSVALAVLFVAGLPFWSSSYLFPALIAAIAVYAVWRLSRVNAETSADWPRWTDKAPW